MSENDLDRLIIENITSPERRSTQRWVVSQSGTMSRILSVSAGCICFFLVGISSFLLPVALYSEAPVFIHFAVEGKAISSYIGPMYDIGACIAFLYIPLASLFRIPDVFTCFLLMIVGTIGSLIGCLFWDFSMHLWSDSSVVILFLGILSGFIGALSLVALFSFVAQFRSVSYVTAVSSGMGSSGIVTTILSTVQDASASPNFSPSWYFAFIALWFILGVISLVIILIFVKREHPEDVPRRSGTQDEVKSIEVEELEEREPTRNSDAPSFRCVTAASCTNVTYGSISDQSEVFDISTPTPPILSRMLAGVCRFSLVFDAAFPAILAIIWCSVMTYLFIPGLAPYLVSGDEEEDSLLLWIDNVWMIGNLVGRLVLIFVLPSKHLLGVGNLLGLLGFFWMAVCALVDGPVLSPGLLNRLVLLACIVLAAVSSGFVTTGAFVYCETNLFLMKRERDQCTCLSGASATSDVRFGIRMVAVTNTIALFLGTTLSVVVVGSGMIS